MKIGTQSVVYRGEALAALLKKKSKSVDLIVTSPPFLFPDVMGTPIRNESQYLDWLGDTVVELRRVARVVLMLHSSRRMIDIISGMSAPRRVLIWDKMVGMGAYRYEPIFVYAEASERLDGVGRIWSDCIRVTPIIGSAQIVPYQNPVRLYYQLQRYFPDFKTVLDPFMGAGTSIIAAELLNKRAEGIEWEAPKFRKAERYIKSQLTQTARREWLQRLAMKEAEEEWTLEYYKRRSETQ